jgi:hypothetical protein
MDIRHKRPGVGFRWLATLALVIASCSAAVAAGSMSVSQELDTEYHYDAGAHTRGAGDVDENSADVHYVISPQVTKNLLLRIGAEWQRYDFGVSEHVPVPDELQSASLILGFDYQFADQWIMRAELQPGVYGDFEDVDWNSVDAPLVLGAVYLKDADLQWFFGLRMDARSEYPVLPAAGVRWKYSDQWTLNLAFPNPRLEFEVTDGLLLYFGADVDAGTYRMSDTFGSDRGEKKLNGAILDYLEVRIGPGCSWRILPNLTIEAEAGLMPYRCVDYFDANTATRSYDAPYGQIACHARF